MIEEKSAVERLIDRKQEYHSNHFNQDCTFQVSSTFYREFLGEIESRGGFVDTAIEPKQVMGHDIEIDESLPADAFKIKTDGVEVND